MANQSGQGFGIPTLARGDTVAGGLERVNYGAANPLSPLAGEGAMAFASVYDGITERMNDRLDLQAAAEGEQAGRLEGSKGVPAKMDPTTIRGRAFNRSAEDAMLTQFDLSSRQNLSDLEQKYQVDPNGFSAAAKSWLSGALPKLQEYDQGLANQFAAAYNLRAEDALNRVKDAHQSLVRDRSTETALNAITAARDDMIRTAPGLFVGDPDKAALSLGNLTLTSAQVKDLAHQIGPDGRPLFSASQRVAFEQETHKEMAKQVAAAWAMKQPDPLTAIATWEKGDAAVAIKGKDGSTQELKLQDVLGPANYQDALDHIRGEISRRITEQRARVDVVDKGLDQAQKLTEQGYDPGKAVLDNLVLQADATGDAATALKARNVRELSGFQSSARQWRPDELQSWINSSQEQLNKQGMTTPQQAEKINLGKKLLETMDTEIKRDPLSWATRVGVIAATPLNAGDPASMQKRLQDATAVSKHYGTPLQLMTDEETTQWKAAFDSAPPDQKASMIGLLAAGFGPDAVHAFADLSKVSPAIANVGGLMGQNPAHAVTARDFAIGDSALAAGAKVMPGEVKLQDAQSTAIGDAYGYAPGAGQAVLDTAARLYAARALRQGKGPDTFDSDLYQKALQEASGAWWDRNGTQHGGIAQQRGFLQGSHRYVLPPNMTETDFDALLKGLKDTDLVLGSVGHGAPLYQDGKAMSPKDLSRFWLMSTGPGRYAISTVNPAAGAPVFLQGTNRDGIYELDVQQLLARKGGKP